MLHLVKSFSHGRMGAVDFHEKQQNMASEKDGDAASGSSVFCALFQLSRIR